MGNWAHGWWEAIGVSEAIQWLIVTRSCYDLKEEGGISSDPWVDVDEIIQQVRREKQPGFTPLL